MTEQVSLPFVDKKVADVLMWRDMKKSGICFGSTTALYLLLNHTVKGSILGWTTYVLAIVISGAYFWALGAGLLKLPGPPVPKFLAEGLSEAEVAKLAETARVPINTVLALLGTLIQGKSPMLSIQVASALYSASRIFYKVSPGTLLFSVFVVAFTVPKLYELKKAEVDKVVAVIKAELAKVHKKLDDAVFSKIPKAGAKKQE